MVINARFLGENSMKFSAHFLFEKWAKSGQKRVSERYFSEKSGRCPKKVGKWPLLDEKVGRKSALQM